VRRGGGGGRGTVKMGETVGRVRICKSKMRMRQGETPMDAAAIGLMSNSANFHLHSRPSSALRTLSTCREGMMSAPPRTRASACVMGAGRKDSSLGR
jgi:hypothetical protein